MGRNEAEIVLSASEAKLVAGLRRGEQAIKTYGQKTLDVFKRANQSIMNFHSRSIGMLGNIGVGVGVVAMTKDVIEFDAALRKIGRTSGASAAEMGGLRKQVMDLIAPGSGIPLTKSEFLDLATALNATGVPMATIKNILPQLGKGAVAAGLDVKTYGAAVGDLLDEYQVAASDLPALQEQLNAVLKMDDVRAAPEEFLRSIQSMSKTMKLMKSEGLANVTPLLALQATLTSFGGSSAEAATSLQGVFDGLLKLGKRKDMVAALQSRGIEFFDAQGGVKNINELLPQFKKLAAEAQKSGKSMEEVSLAVFGRPEAAKAIIAITQRYDEIMERQGKIRNSTGGLAKDFATESESMEAKLKKFQNQLDLFKTTHMSSALKHVSSLLDYLNRHPIIAKGLMTAIVGAGGLVMANKLIEAFRGVRSVFTGGKGAGGLGGPVPVFVTNSAAGGLAGGLVGKLGGLLGKAGLVGTVAAGAYALGTNMVQRSGGLVEKLSGGKYGGEGWIGSMIYDAIHGKDGIKNDISMTVNVDGKRVSTDVDNTNTKLAVKRGKFNIGD